VAIVVKHHRLGGWVGHGLIESDVPDALHDLPDRPAEDPPRDSRAERDLTVAQSLDAV
jgi:hypothetical protein